MASKRFKIVPKHPVKKDKVCIACNGSGRYDSCGSPKCGSCGGTGVDNGR